MQMIKVTGMHLGFEIWIPIRSRYKTKIWIRMFHIDLLQRASYVICAWLWKCSLAISFEYVWGRGKRRRKNTSSFVFTSYSVHRTHNKVRLACDSCENSPQQKNRSNLFLISKWFKMFTYLVHNVNFLYQNASDKSFGIKKWFDAPFCCNASFAKLSIIQIRMQPKEGIHRQLMKAAPNGDRSMYHREHAQQKNASNQLLILQRILINW